MRGEYLFASFVLVVMIWRLDCPSWQQRALSPAAASLFSCVRLQQGPPRLQQQRRRRRRRRRRREKTTTKTKLGETILELGLLWEQQQQQQQKQKQQQTWQLWTAASPRP